MKNPISKNCDDIQISDAMELDRQNLEQEMVNFFDQLLILDIKENSKSALASKSIFKFAENQTLEYDLEKENKFVKFSMIDPVDSIEKNFIVVKKINGEIEFNSTNHNNEPENISSNSQKKQITSYLGSLIKLYETKISSSSPQLSLTSSLTKDPFNLSQSSSKLSDNNKNINLSELPSMNGVGHLIDQPEELMGLPSRGLEGLGIVFKDSKEVKVGEKRARSQELFDSSGIEIECELSLSVSSLTLDRIKEPAGIVYLHQTRTNQNDKKRPRSISPETLLRS
jgi:hypothetical protein